MDQKRLMKDPLGFVACSLICNIARNNVLPVCDSSSLENSKDIRNSGHQIENQAVIR